MAKHRKSLRRRSTKKSRSTRRRSRMLYGGSPANVGIFALGSKDLPQGNQFLDMHRDQHGGANANLPKMLRNALQMGGAAPLDTMGQPLLPSSLYDNARVAATYAQYGQIAGMKDQAGGRRRRAKGRKGKKTHRRSVRRSRKMRGGAMDLTPAEIDWKEAIGIPQGVNPQFASWNAAA
jgi:hypothetical protein